MNDSFNKESLNASEEEHEMLDYLIEQERQSHLKSQRIFPRPSAQNPSLSFAQQRLWVVEQMVATGNAYNWCLAIRLRGMLSSEVVAKCLTEIVRRHEVLRTTIEVSNSEPYQVINPSSPVRMDTIEFLDLTEEEADSSIKDLVAEAGRDIFDLARGPLLKVRLLGLGDQDHVLILSMHHIVSDGWSLGLLLDEFASLYKAYRQHQTSPLPELSLQYADYSVWQRNWLVGEELERQLSYWRQQLQGAETLALPTDRLRPAVATFNGNHEVRQLDNDLRHSLTDLAQREGVTLFILTLSVFVVLLHKYCAQDDIVVGSPVASRNRIEIENLIGFFVNMLVFRTDTSGNPTFQDVLARVKQTGLAVFEHQDLPFERLVEALAKGRDMSRNPLFQVSFALQQEQPEAIDIEEGLSLSLVPAGNSTARFDLELFVSEGQQGLNLLAVYNTDLFDAETINRMLSHYQLLLEAMVTNPDMRIADAPMLGEQERQQVVIDWNQTKTDYPREQTVQALFEGQVSQTPDACAVEYDGDSLSYCELNERANQLAHYLQANGVGPEVKVGLFVERGLDMVVALLGILKSGGAYVPLDLDYPSSRIAFMLEDAEVPVLLTTAKLTARLPERACERICLDIDWAQIEQERADNPEITTTAGSLAYVIYTSGSTGIPKGVEIPHHAINRLVRDTDYYPVDASDRIAQASSVSFDAATFEVWGALLNGAQLVGIDKNTLLNSNALAALLREKGVTTMFITTAVFNQIAREVPDAFQGLRAVMFGGEAVDCNAVRRVLKHCPPQRLLHVYGPTESTTFASWYPIESVAEDATTVPIGRPLANTTLYVLDANRRPVPVGVPGELYIGGDGLARGYLNRAELTAERFVPNPFEAGGKLYRTGDKVRFRADGAIEFQGRFDHQVKLRGFRIELGEIETALIQLESVSDAVVVIREDDTGDRRLDAYVVPTAGWIELNPSIADGPEAEEPLHLGLIAELRQQLRQQLPAYMMPSVYVLLDALPLNPNGKVERKALQVPGDIRASLGAEYTAPRNELERELARIWTEVLKLERVGIHDNFFDLGGHSLMATQVVSRIRAQLNVELPLSEMFGYPTVAELAPVMESLRDDGDGVEVAVIPLADRSKPMPLSFAQERLWFLDQLDPDSAAYNMCLALRLKGELSVAALTDSLNAIVSRQQALRTHFSLHQGKPIQIIDEAGIELRQDDLSALPSEMLERDVKILIDEEASQLFDLSTGPLLQGRLLRLSDHEHVLSLTMHHIISDGWSLGVLFRELGDCYAAFTGGKQPVLPELPIQYADFAVWQRDWLSGEVLDSQLTYWQQKLKDLTPLDLPVDRPRPSVKTYNGAFETLKLDTKLCQQLERLSQQAGVTPFMTLLAGFAVLMHRYSGQDDIVIGSPIANRNRSEVEQLIGFFVNILVLRLDVSGNPDFRTLLGQAQETTLGAYQHQDIPFEKLVEVLQPERDRSRNPIFQIQFSLQNAPIEPLKLKGLKLEPVRRRAQSTRFDLECHIWPRETGLEAVFVYNTDLFDAATIKALLEHYQTLLAGLVADPDRRISELAMLSPHEMRQLSDWNRTSTDYPADKTVHELFEMQAATTPDAIAVDYAGDTLSYAELNQRANQLAHYLQARGVGPEVKVGLFLERSLEMIVALLGILKAGGAYLPLDPDYPEPRLTFMLEDAQVPILLSLSTLSERLPDFTGDRVYLDSDWASIAREKKLSPVSDATADNLIYVIYTSGSTGRPKGTLIAHRSAVRLVKQTNYVELGPDEVMLQFAPISFDASTFEIWGSLLNGARLAVFPAGRSALEELGQFIQQKGVTTLWLTSALFSQMVDNHLASLSGVRQVLAGGEALSLPQVKKMLEQLGEGRLINGYGPTENTTFTCCHVMTTASELGQSVPIGRPISNTTVYILDDQMRPVPIGVPGELYIGGDGLARGYLNQAELTAEKFIADPFSERGGARLYRTGDEVRYRRDGTIEFLGRFDDQVKIRGFRIEPGEIETLLAQHETVRDAAVVVQGVDADDKRLVAYVVAEKDALPDVAELRNHVRHHLPDYMLPAAFMILDEFPVTANGKLDRRALPAPGDMRDSLVSEHTPPRSGLEQQLTQIWAQVLKLERVGIHDNFFDLGGHSLMATQVVSRIRAQLNVELPLSEMFGYPTVAELAQVMASLLDDSDGEKVEVIPLADRNHPLPLSFAQERLWFLDQLEPGSVAYNMCLALRLKGELNVSALTDSLNAIVGRQEGLRTRFTMHQGKPYQIIEDVTIELVQDDLSALASGILEDEVNTRIDAEALLPFDLSTGPLLRCRLLRQSDREHVLMLTMHHVISDGWSLGVMFRELGVCYEAFRRGEQPALAELSIQYADFAVWQREWLSGEVLASQMAYWREKLEGLSTLDLPTDRPRPAVQTYTGSMEKMRLDAELSKRLKSLSRQVGVTLFMTMLAGFAVLMHRYSGQEDIVVGTPIANRNRSELEDLIGFFVNSLVMRTDVSGNPGFRELVQRVNRTALDAYQHQDLPFEKLVDEIQLERDLSHNPLFQVMFALQNAPIESLDLKGLTLESVSREIKVSGFDLECHVWERGDRLEVVFVYNTDLFDASTIRRMMTHYRRLLDTSTASPETPVGQLEILDDEEKQLMLRQWNQTQADYVENETLHSLFDQQVRRTPQAIAVSFEMEQLSYSDLEQKANQVARLLVARKIAPGQFVGIFMERSIDLVVAILGILKAGAAYVPLDPDYPQQRNNFIIADSNVRLLLSQQKFANQLQSTRADIIYIDNFEFDEPVAAQSMPVVTEDMLAYVIYTSGSTGEPKGVMVSHEAVVNHACWLCDLFELDQSDRLLQNAPISFDASAGNIFPALLSGASVVLPVPGGHSDSEYLLRVIRQQEITIVILVPAALRMLLQGLDDPADLGTLKRVGCGGEAVTPDLQREYYKHCTAPLYNLYGPTETTIDATSFLCETGFTGDNIPIGSSVSNSYAYILDQSLQPVPIGVQGELHIGGKNLARGYLNRPELTAEKFIADPFSNDSAARLYKTGDLARYRVDGNIEFIGRVDEQVKIRGFRIELDEIESLLMSHPGVQETVVIVREDKPGDKRLVAYIVDDGGKPDAPSVTELREYLRAKLPDYMLPSTFIGLDSIPLSANGKLDRRALPMPDGARQLDQALVEPRSDLEKQLAEIWQDVLAVEKVGIHDNFFDLGGHSLKLVELHKKLGDKIDTPLTLVDLFAHPTVSALVEHITKPQTPTRARSGEVDRVTNMAAGKKRLKQLRQSRKRNTGIKG